MTDRGLDSALDAAVDDGNIRLLVFVKLEFDSGTIYLHNGVGTYTFDSQNWLGVGDFGGISDLTESTELSPYEINLVLSGLDSTMFDEVLNQQYYLRPVTIYIGALDIDTGALVSDPNEIWSGTMDTASISIGNENNLVITCESEFSIFEKVNGSVFSDADIQNTYSGDLFFKWLNAMEDVVIRWGHSNVGTARSTVTDSYGPSDIDTP